MSGYHPNQHHMQQQQQQQQQYPPQPQQQQQQQQPYPQQPQQQHAGGAAGGGRPHQSVPPPPPPPPQPSAATAPTASASSASSSLSHNVLTQGLSKLWAASTPLSSSSFTTTTTADPGDGGRNVGFTPTPQMMQRHEQIQQQQQAAAATAATATASSSALSKKAMGGGGGGRQLLLLRRRRPLFQFQVTKLRSWRTGYTRLLVLYDNEFVTLDPAGSSSSSSSSSSSVDIHNITGSGAGDYAQPTQTNAWNYTLLTDWLALPDGEPDSILLQVDKKDKLKFQCHDVHRSVVLSALLQCKDAAAAAAANSNNNSSITTTTTIKTFPHVERWTRHGTKQSVVLIVKPYGIQEVHVTTLAVLQTYLFKDIRAVSLANNNTNNNGNNSTSDMDPYSNAAPSCSLYLHFRQARKIRLYEVHSTSTTGVGNRQVNANSNANTLGQGRTELIAAMQEQYELLGLQLQMEVSMTMSDWLRQRQGLSSTTSSLLGPIATSWPVSKATRRHDARIVGNHANSSSSSSSSIGDDSNSSSSSWMGGVVRRTLCITAKAWLLECDGNNNMISMRHLHDLWAVVRHEGSRADQVTLIYTDGSQRSYTCTCSSALHGGGGGGGIGSSSARDALVVSILDAAATMANNTTVHLLSDCHLYRGENGHDEHQDLQQNFYSTFGGTVHCSESLTWNREVLYRIQHGIPTASSAASPSSGTTGSKAVAVTGAAAAAALFQPVSISIYCLRRIHTLSTRAYAYVSGDFNLHPPSSQQQQQSSQLSPSSSRQKIMSTQELLIQVKGTVEACREFNANVLPTGEGLSTATASSSSSTYKPDKVVAGTIGALWGLVAKLLLVHQQQQQVSMPPMNHHLQQQHQHQDESSSLTAATNRNLRDLQMAEQAAATILQALFRLSKTPTGYHASVELTTFQECISVLCAIQDTFCKFWALSVLKVLLSGLPPTIPRDMETEYVNKSVILKIGGQALVHGLVSALLQDAAGSSSDSSTGNAQQEERTIATPVSDLILMVTSDILQSLLCSFHDTTSPEVFASLIQALGMRYLALLATLRSQTAPFVIENTALLLHLLSTHAPETNARIRDAALSSGILLSHFYAAIFSPLEGQRFLSRYLCGLWLSGPMDCPEKRLLQRMLPHGFLAYLSMPALSKMEQEQLDAIERDADKVVEEASSAPTAAATTTAAEVQGAAGTNTARLRARMALARSTQKVSVERMENFRIFFHVLTQDSQLADLIWNQQTRRELRIALEGEIQYVQREREARGDGNIAWNHQQFRVHYRSLDNEIKVGNVYMRLWLQAGDGFIKSWEEPLRLFELLFRRFLCEIDRNTPLTIMCIRCLERLYAIHSSAIGPFSDVIILVHTMASTKSIETQHRLLQLLATLLGVTRKDDDDDDAVANIPPDNAEQLLNTESIGQLCQFVAWGHTNGVQAENLLSRALAANNKRPMITNGSSRGPECEDKNSTGTVAVPKDEACPPVWFVAATGRIPPPPELVRGPFRVSDLIKMMDQGDLSPFDLVTASCVENYDETSTSSIQEAHIDTGKWKRLNQVWQLRWQLCTDDNKTGIYSPAEVCLLAMRALTRLVELHKSLDSSGVPYVPIPIAKRILSGRGREASICEEAGASPLSILSQSLLCNDSHVVDESAKLLFKLLEYNDDAIPKFYLTGAFFFALGYHGSNFISLARLLEATHLRQHFRSGFAAAANKRELPMKDRSILGHLLPEGLLCILVNYGFDRFAKVFVSNADTPEVIWTLEMRKHLVDMIAQHLGDFPLRLFQNNTVEYEYCPIPTVAYTRLQKEIFCHNYYLENLCDEERFPDWPIAEPVEVFRSCLERFKQQVDGDEDTLAESMEQARKLLELQEGDGSKELRRAYRSMARRYHPDKNPAGREMFEAIQKSYELLLPQVEAGNKIHVFATAEGAHSNDAGFGDACEGIVGGKLRMQTMQLLMQTQLLICRRYENEMSRFKYPAYSFLLYCVKLPPSCRDALRLEDLPALLGTCLVLRERAEFIQTASELCFWTCRTSPRNSSELVAESGLAVLASLVHFYLQVLVATSKCKVEANVASDSVFTSIVSHAVQTLSGIAFFHDGREGLNKLDNLSRLVVDWRRCMDGSILGRSDKDVSMTKFALEGISNMAQDRHLQQEMIKGGVVWPLLRLALLYDPTLEEDSSIADDPYDQGGTSAVTSNMHARLAVRALGMLSGALPEAARNDALADTLDTLLTVPIARMLRNKRTNEILRVLNSNVEEATVIWNASMRRQLEALVVGIEKDRTDASSPCIEDELRSAGSIEYDSLKNEVSIGGVYVRIFNKHGKDAANKVENVAAFGRAVVHFIARSLNESEILEDWAKIPVEGESETEHQTEYGRIDSPEFMMALTALLIMARVDGLVDDVLYQSTIVPSVLLSLLELHPESDAFQSGCELLAALSPKQPFADLVASQGSIWRLLLVLERPEANEASNSTESDTGEDSQRKIRVWSVLESLSSSTSVATQLMSSSGWMELLGVLVGYSKFTKVWSGRIGAAKALSRMLWDPTTGGRAGPLLQRFLPATLILLLKEEPEAMLKCFDQESDTPELIWEKSMRSELRRILGEQLDRCLEQRTSGMALSFTLAPDVRVRYTALENELYLGGVYVTRFLKEPTFKLRDPTSFLESLLERWGKELDSYTSRETDSNTRSRSDAITEAGQDTLQLVTTAAVYLCKVRDSLCDKLAQWGYIARSMTALGAVLSRELIGTPLLSIIRLLHVASSRMVNIEALAVIGDVDGKRGIVDFSIQSMGSQQLHPDCAYMVEMLFKVYEKALGDVKAVRRLPVGTQGYNQHSFPAPSPAPGEDPVRRGGHFCQQAFPAPSPAPGEGPVGGGRDKVNFGDDPLAMMGMSFPAAQASQSAAPSYAQAPTMPQNQASYYGVPGQQQQPSYQAQQQPLQQPISSSFVTPGLYQPSTSQQSGGATPLYSHQQATQDPRFMSYQQPGALPQPPAPLNFGSNQALLVSQQQAQSPAQSIGPIRQQQYEQQAHGGYRTQNYPHSGLIQGGYQQPVHPQQQQQQQQQQGTIYGGYTQQPPPQQQLQQTSTPGAYQQHHQHQQQQRSPIISFHGSEQQPQIAPTQGGYQPQPQHQLRQQQQPQYQQQSMTQDPYHQQQPQQPPMHAQQQASSMQAQTVYQQHQHPQQGSLPGANQQQQHQASEPHYPTAPPPSAAPPPPMVETATDSEQQQSHGGIDDPIMEGSGIDARTPVDPIVTAEQKAVSTAAAPGAAQGRLNLLQQALHCRLCDYLVDSFLENETLSTVKDPGAGKVHAIALLKLLTKDPGYGMKFKLALDDLPAWQKYKSQDHSLFITSAERTDYFLTDGGSSSADTKLLTQSGH